MSYQYPIKWIVKNSEPLSDPLEKWHEPDLLKRINKLSISSDYLQGSTPTKKEQETDGGESSELDRKEKHLEGKKQEKRSGGTQTSRRETSQVEGPKERSHTKKGHEGDQKDGKK